MKLRWVFGERRFWFFFWFGRERGQKERERQRNEQIITEPRVAAAAPSFLSIRGPDPLGFRFACAFFYFFFFFIFLLWLVG